MSYNSSKGPREFGDIKNEDDVDTQIDFGSDSIILRTAGAARLEVTNNHVSASGPMSGSEFRAEVSLSSSMGITGSSLQVGAYGWTNSGILTVNALNATSFSSTSLSASEGITGSSLQIGDYGWTNAGIINVATLNGVNVNGSTSLSSSQGITGSSLQIGDYGLTNDGRVALNTITLGGALISSTGTEINLLDGSSAGSAVASKAVIYDAQKGLIAQSVTGSVLSASYNLLTANLTASQGLLINTDNKAVTVGAGSDLSIYHDSTNSIIKNSTGHLTINNNATDKHIRLKLGEDNADTAVQIRNSSDSSVWGCDALGNMSGSGTADIGGKIHTTSDLVVSGNTWLGDASGDATRISGSLSVSGSLLGHQFYPTRHAYNTSATTEKWIPFYNISEANAPNNATYINQMVVPFSGQLKRVYLRPSGAIDGVCTVRLYKASDGNGLVNTDEQGVLVETQIKTLPDTAATTSIYIFTGSNHYSAGEVVGITVHPTSNPVDFNIICLWEYNVFGL